MLRVATLVSIFALAACAEQGDEGMNVLNNTAVTGMGCTFSGAASQPFLAHGEIYARSPTGYFLAPLVQSRIVSQPGIDPIQTTIQLRSANIELTLKSISVHHRADDTFTDTQPNVSLAPTTSLFSGAVPPGGTANVGFDVISPAGLRDVLARSAPGPNDTVRAEVLAGITIFGDLNGDEVVSTPFFFPISVCTGCIVDVVGSCPLPVGSSPRPGNPCNAFQDGVVDCCTDGAGDLVCPAAVATM